MSFVTRRTINSQLLFVNNKRLEERVLGTLGKYLKKYSATIYAYNFYGSHDHAVIDFKPRTKSNFFRDFGARTAEAVRMYVDCFKGGPLFQRRASEQCVPENYVVNRFWYTTLQAVQDGHCKKISQYPGYNSFYEAISGKPRRVKFTNWTKFRAAKARDPKANIEDYTDYTEINYARLPGYEHLSQREYKKLMSKELKEREAAIVEQLEAKGHKFPSPERLRNTTPTQSAKNPKKSKRFDKRPLVLTNCFETKKWFLEWYFSILNAYRRASARYLLGDPLAEFPPGTWKPLGPITA